MRIVDLRPAALRGLLNRWEGAAPASGPVARLAAAVTGLPADLLLARRVKRRARPAAPPFVVSVGNLALGGTGKTPVVAALAADLAKRGLTGAVLSRGYGSRLAGPVLVTADLADAGDEARLLAGRLAPAGWRVIQAHRRADGLALLRDGGPPDVVIVEDGHQTAHVGRHLDVVILDRWRQDAATGRVTPATGPVFPFGPWRESPRGAARAGVWLLEADAGRGFNGPPGVDVTGFRREFRWAAGAAPKASRVALLSGIARPQAFERTAAGMLPSPPALALRCPDHAAYEGGLLRRIRQECDAARIEAVVVTEKDRVKLDACWSDGPELHVLEMNVRWTGERALPDLVGERLDAVRGEGAG